MAFSSTKLNGKDTLVYLAELKGTSAAPTTQSDPFELPARLVTLPGEKGTTRYLIHEFSSDETKLLVSQMASSTYEPIYLVDLTLSLPLTPVEIKLPYPTEEEAAISNKLPTFSKDPSKPNVIYMITNAYGDFDSVVAYDLDSQNVLHITTPTPSLGALRPVPWGVSGLNVAKEFITFRANADGWDQLFVMCLSGQHKNKVVEVELQWEGGTFRCASNYRNDDPYQLGLMMSSHEQTNFIATFDLAAALSGTQTASDGLLFCEAQLVRYDQAAPPPPSFKTRSPKLLRYKSFDGLEVPCMYYHPSSGKQTVPLVISIHGGPEGQSTSQSRTPIHWYLMNELGCAVLYPNVRGSSGYGKRYLMADDVEKREDSVEDIGALLDHIKVHMPNELDSSKIAVMGGSYGGYMVFACLTHFSSKLTCGVANFGIAHWPSFLRNTAPHRRAHRRREYGDETIPEICEFLERISPLNNAHKITVPLSIAHGETDSRVTVEEAIRMWDIVTKNGVDTELMVCELEGHGRQPVLVREHVC